MGGRTRIDGSVTEANAPSALRQSAAAFAGAASTKTEAPPQQLVRCMVRRLTARVASVLAVGVSLTLPRVGQTGREAL